MANQKSRDFDARYEEYQREAADIMSKEDTACMTRKNETPRSDPKTWAQINQEETEAFWEKAKCLTH